MNRRLFLCSVAAAPLVLGGCASFTTIANKLYLNIEVVAQKLEALVIAVSKGAMTVGTAAANLLAQGSQYVVPSLRIFVSLTTLAGTIASQTPALQANVSFNTALGKAQTLANAPAIQAAVQTGVLPSDPVTLISNVITLAAQIYTLTHGAATPTVAARTA